MNKARLAILLSKLQTFKSPRAELEQYPTDSETASLILWSAKDLGDIENKTIADFGCGTGILGLGALLLGAKKVYFIDKSESAVRTAKENMRFLEKELNLRLEDKSNFFIGDISLFNKKADTIIENPPFGTKKAHIDRVFLEKAMCKGKVIYSIHKSSTLDYLRRLISKNKRKITHQIKLNLKLKQTMPWHRSKTKNIDTICLRIA